MDPLSTYYIYEVNVWFRTNPRRIINQFQISKLFGTIYCKAVILQNVVTGFAKTGLFPTNPEVFTELDFAEVVTGNRQLIEDEVSNCSIERTDEHPPGPIGKLSGGVV